MTELVFILDRSGSMAGLESDTIGGFNGMLEKQKGDLNDTLVTTVLFNTRIRTIHDRISLDKLPKLTKEDYFVGGGTALLDAVGTTINHIEMIHKYARKEDVPNKTLFVITTDGMENASRKYSYDQIRNMIESKKEQDWEFIFLAANIDVFETAARMGISENLCAEFVCDSDGVKCNYDELGNVVETLRTDHYISPAWKDKIVANTKNKQSGK